VYYNVCYGRAFRTHEAHVGNLRKIVDSVSGDDLEEKLNAKIGIYFARFVSSVIMD
jgi:hypothetical protein